MTEYSVMTPKQHFCLPTTPPLVTFNRQLSEDPMLFFSNIVTTESAVLLIYDKRNKIILLLESRAVRANPGPASSF